MNLRNLYKFFMKILDHFSILIRILVVLGVNRGRKVNLHQLESHDSRKEVKQHYEDNSCK